MRIQIWKSSDFCNEFCRATFKYKFLLNTYKNCTMSWVEKVNNKAITEKIDNSRAIVTKSA